MTARDFATDVVRTLQTAGHEALFAGGCVRDQFLGLEPDDFDVATSAHPPEVQKLFPRSFAVGAGFGVIEVLGPKPHKVQVATFRSDGPYSDARRPDHVTFSSAKLDAERRDFTINGMFFDPLSGKLIDHVGGEADLRARTLRAIGKPAARFQEDRLRMLRAVRFAARFGLSIDPATWDAIKAMASEVVSVSGERIAEELRKLLSHTSRAIGVTLLHDSGLLKAVLPEASPHLAELAGLSEASFSLAMSVLLAETPPAILEDMFDRLKLANSERDRMRWLLKHRNSLAHPQSLQLHQLKPILANEFSDELLSLHRAFGHVAAADWCAERLLDWPAEKLNPAPLISGDDLLAMGLQPGPKFKLMLESVRNAQLDEQISTQPEARALIERFDQNSPHR